MTRYIQQAVIYLVVLVPAACGVPEKKAPPVYNPVDINPELVDPGLRNIDRDYRVADFTLIDQLGDTITQKDFQNKIYVVDFFFTRCPGICPVMSANMGKIQEEFRSNEKVLLLSVSVTPEYDSVPVLLKYAQDRGAIPSKWHITTGDKKHIYQLARKSYFMASDQGDGGMQDFIHTPNFELIDTKGRIRGIYDGTREVETARLLADMKALLR